MRSALQVKANCQNAAKSTQSKTPEVRARVGTWLDGALCVLRAAREFDQLKEEGNDN